MAWPTFRFKPNDIWTTTLDGTITAATDPISVVDNTDAEDGPGLFVLENEIIYYATKGANQFSTLTRGYNSTTAAGHATGIEVKHPISADTTCKLWDAVEALYGGALDIVTTKGDILVASAADTLARLARGADKTLLNIGTDTPAWIAPADLGKVGDADTVDTFDLVPDISGGWFPAGETWTYASADDPTFTFTLSAFDATSKYSAGMKIKLTQTTVKYFIITKVVFDDPGSTITVYGGTDYNLADAAITLPYYSTQKAPLSFPLDPAKWTVEITDATDRTQATAVQNTWYNLGSVSIDIPVGCWDIKYKLALMASTSGRSLFVTLSTANDSEINVNFTRGSRTKGDTYEFESIYWGFPLNLSTKDTYYLNTRTTSTGTPDILNVNSDDKLFIRAVCAYL